jgi:myo-inositol 2-dehydrogenase/D-chiro-inositol 1-dehydrogenase
MPTNAMRPMERRRLGVAVIGCGRIGSLRAKLAAEHPAVRFVGVADRDRSRARGLAEKIGAQFWSSENLEVMAHPDVNAIVISTIEVEHFEPLMQAFSLGKPVLVEKPLALDLETADRLIAAAGAGGSTLRVGYSRRFKKRYLIAKEQIVQGRLGRITGGAARVYNSRSQAMQTLARLPNTGPSLSGLVYYIDTLHWMLEGNPPVEVYARGQANLIRQAGYDKPDLIWAIVTLADGAILNFGECYALPHHYPSLGHAARVEVIGADGILIVDDDHTDQILCSVHGAPHVYIPEHTVNTVFLGSGTPGDWALGEFIGPVATETRAWLDHLATGRDCFLATAQEARRTIEVTEAIKRSLQTGTAVRIPLG